MSFRGADLTRVNFSKARLRCDFSAANLNGASFREADLRGSRLQGINVFEVDWKKAVIDLEQAVTLAEAFGARLG